MSRYWQEYVRAAYDLILESEGQVAVYLDHDVEAYVVHLFAKNFERTDIGDVAIAIKMLNVQNRAEYQPIGDECLLVNSWPIKRRRWPSDTYYKEMGCIAYGMAGLNHMESNFDLASKVLHKVFSKTAIN